MNGEFMPDACFFCDLLKNSHEDPTFIAEFEHSVAFLNYEQEAYPGASILIFKDHYDHLHLAPLALQKDVVVEMTELTAAILKAFGGFRANHMSLGNSVSHLHWHVIPRYPNDLNSGGMPDYLLDEKRLSDDAFRARAKVILNVLEN